MPLALLPGVKRRKREVYIIQNFLRISGAACSLLHPTSGKLALTGGGSRGRFKIAFRYDEKKERGRGVVTKWVIKRQEEIIQRKGAKAIKVESFRQKE